MNKIGIIDMRGMKVYNKDIAEMVRWLVLDRVAILTGYFPNSTDFLQKLPTGDFLQLAAVCSVPVHVTDLYSNESAYAAILRSEQVRLPAPASVSWTAC